MTEPTEQPPSDLAYATVDLDGNARTLILLSVIFNYIIAGLNCLYFLYNIGMAFFMYSMFDRMAKMPPPHGAAPAAMPPMFILAIYPIAGAFGLAAGIVQFIGTNKLRKRSPNAWGWGLAVAIISCTELWCSIFCIFPLASGVYSIIILSQQRVRNYLARGPAAA